MRKQGSYPSVRWFYKKEIFHTRRADHTDDSNHPFEFARLTFPCGDIVEGRLKNDK